MSIVRKETQGRKQNGQKKLEVMDITNKYLGGEKLKSQQQYKSPYKC